MSGVATNSTRVRRVVGCMTGTSIDGLDVALVEVRGTGLEMQCRVLRLGTRELGALQRPLRAFADGAAMTADAIATMAHDFGVLHAEAIAELLAGERADLVCVHGQTVFHKPPVSWQLLNPWPIVQRIGARVVYDLRGADLAAGGQGAPITPIADAVLLGSRPEFVGGLANGFAVINLGGFANYTAVPAAVGKALAERLGTIRGGDVCVCNQLLDRIARERLGVAFDADGARAAAGRADAAACERLVAMIRPSEQGRSLGTGDESFAWVKETRASLESEDAAATACEAIGRVIAESLRGLETVLLAGGGARNRALAAAISRHGARYGARVRLIDDFGIAATHREAIEFAVLGALCEDRVAITLPSVTGVGVAPISGAWAG
ncbi:MAG TPA: anhydro-N-acetylmuramic acid kinase [Phycisphaerales bacterium]